VIGIGSEKKSEDEEEAEELGRFRKNEASKPRRWWKAIVTWTRVSAESCLVLFALKGGLFGGTSPGLMSPPMLSRGRKLCYQETELQIVKGPSCRGSNCELCRLRVLLTLRH
jgi:hypothetical protein